MAFTKVQIISLALQAMGKKGITNLDQNDLSDSAEDIFDMLVLSELETGNWRFAVTVVQLAQINAAPPTISRFSKIYQLPLNFLKLICLIPLTYDFELYENKQLWTNYTGSLYLEYAFLPVIGNFSNAFCFLLVYLIAEFLCLSNAQSVQYAQYFTPKVDYWRGRAMAADAQNRPQTELQSQPVISQRYIGSSVDG